jgi:cytidyltransferase-like protein
MQKIIIVSGYFDPIHKGHLEYFINAKAKGDLLFVIINSDHQRALKGSKEFQKEDERLFIVQHIKEVARLSCQLIKIERYVRPWNTFISSLEVNSD